MNKAGIGGHQKAVGDTQVWLTPPELIQSLGHFDLDPCAPVVRPWDTADHHFTEQDNGLTRDWFGRVWHNPPYDRTVISIWLEKMAKHGIGITLIFARTETEYFQKWVFPFAESILFLKGRITFHLPDGTKAKANGGAPSVLISYTEQDACAIDQSGLTGRHQLVNALPVVVVEQSPSWKNVVAICMIRLNGVATLKQMYGMVSIVAQDKTAKNRHYREKIRQVLQKHFNRIRKGEYSNG